MSSLNKAEKFNPATKILSQSIIIENFVKKFGDKNQPLFNKLKRIHDFRDKQNPILTNWLKDLQKIKNNNIKTIINPVTNRIININGIIFRKLKELMQLTMLKIGSEIVVERQILNNMKQKTEKI